MKTAKKLLMTAVGTACFAFSAGIAEAAKFTLTAEGGDSGLNTFSDLNDFFKLSFESGPDTLYIKEFSLYLSPDANAVFDVPPFPGIGDDSDIVDADIIDVFLSNNSQTATVIFVDGAFTLGETLEFGVDTDRVGPGGFFDIFDPGIDFGLADITFSVLLSDGRSGTGIFEIESFIPSKSVAVVHVPEPTTVFALFAMGSLSAFSLKRSRH
ncbi:MAG: PEP-CTERM sorting domain-containing protein [Cyanobacteria bacterium P01_H01_bin.35]